MKTYLINCRIIDTKALKVIEDGIVVIDHVHEQQAPDYLVWCGDKDDKDAPDLNVVDMDDKIIDVKGYTVLPGLIDINCKIDEGIGNLSTRSLAAYKKCGKALTEGLLTIGTIRDKDGVLDAVEECINKIELWGSRVIGYDKLEDNISIISNIFDVTKEELSEIITKSDKKLAVGTGSAPYDYSNNVLPIYVASKLLVEAGMTPMEALSSITYNAAEVLGVSETCGNVKKGYEGDFIITKGKPDKEISELENIFLVSRGGRLVWSHIENFELSRFNILPPGYKL